MRTGLVPILSEINRLLMDEEHRDQRDDAVIDSLLHAKKWLSIARSLKQARDMSLAGIREGGRDQLGISGLK